MAHANLPPVGWADVATKQDLEALRNDIESLRTKDLAALRESVSKDMQILEHRLEARLERGFRRQTVWIVSVLFAQSGLVAWLLGRIAGS